MADDQYDLQPGDRVLLVAVDDPEVAESAVQVGREHGFRVVATLQPERALDLARELAPAAAVVGLGLVTPDGTPVLDALKRSPDTRHIPVHALAVGDSAVGDSAVGDSAVGDSERAARTAGAIGVLPAPVSPAALAAAVASLGAYADERVRRLLVVVGDAVERAAVAELVAGPDVAITTVVTPDDAVGAVRREHFDCLIVDAAQLDQAAKYEELAGVPVVLARAGEPEQLVDQTALFLHRKESTLPPSRRRMIENLRSDDRVFADRTVLIVDDDVRNVFALTSVLERHGLTVLYAENGRAGIEALEQHPDVDLVLMDVMMPEMDGHRTAAAIRAMPQFSELPIIALTAKAMKGDREKSIAAGASDYVAKPVDVGQLLAMLRSWLGRRPG